MDYELKRVLQEMRQRKSDSFTLSWNINFSTSRVAFLLMDGSAFESCRASISFILYGINGGLKHGELCNDEALALHIDGVRLFGEQGCCLLSIGIIL